MSLAKQQEKQYIAQTYGRFDLTLERGKGVVCHDDEGRRYLDLTSGIGVNALGFCDRDWVDAVSKQAATIQHTSNLYYTKPCGELAQKLTRLTGYSRVFFSNSGAEANEGAIKTVRKYSFDKYGRGRDTIICLQNSFHGRTVTTLSATGQEAFYNYFFPFTEGFRFVEPNDIGALEQAIDKTVCAVMFEPVQGEGGVVPLEQEYLAAMDKLCRERGILLIADEVQTGVGRTGTLLACEQLGVKPDITTLAKGLGGGLPIGAVLLNDKTADVLGPGDHGTTYGGNPVACAGANVCIDKISSPTFLDMVQKKGELIRAVLSGVEEVESVAGLGMMVGIKLKNKSAKDVANACIEKGLLVLTAKEKVRLLPPLTITVKELSEALEILKEVLNQSV